MRTYLLTIRGDHLLAVPGGREVGLRLSELRDRPDLGAIGPGTWVELACPDGLRRRIRLTGLFVEGGWVGDDGTLYDFENNPRIVFRFSPPLKDALAPVGTVLWLVHGPPGEDDDGG
jgi:hypothetical protein